MTTKQKRAPIETAAARAGGRPITIPVTYSDFENVDWDRFDDDDDYAMPTATVNLRFSPEAGTQLLALLDEIQHAAQKPIQDQVEIMLRFLDAAAVGKTTETLVTLQERKQIDIGTIMQIGSALMDEVTGAIHPTRRPSSPGSGSDTGATSTAGALPEASMPPPSPSTAS